MNERADDLAALRRDYGQRGLSEAEVSADPLAQFRQWFDEAVRAGVNEPNAMVLATATPSGAPSARVVLLKGLDEGFVFFTNYDSHKGRELEGNPQAALVFFWPELERQVRIEGQVVRTSELESDEYFQRRPRGSQLGAWASAQSDVVANRAALEASLETVTQRYADREVPRPAHWGGYRLNPRSIEFWQGRPSRLHDRLQYARSEQGWNQVRLSP